MPIETVVKMTFYNELIENVDVMLGENSTMNDGQRTTDLINDQYIPMSQNSPNHPGLHLHRVSVSDTFSQLPSLQLTASQPSKKEL